MTLTVPAEFDTASSVAPPIRIVSGDARPEDVLRLVEARLRAGRLGHLRFLRSRLRSREDAEDVLQEFALKAIQGADRLTDLTKVEAWLSITLRNALFDRYRRNAGCARLQDSARAEPTYEPEEPEELDRPLDCLTHAIDDLKPEAAALLRRAELQETPLKAIADAMAITANNAGVRVHRAREALRQAMKTRCAACATPCPLAVRFIERIAA
jgi:RNA polymerase sigma factor (sigma-70 family)